MRTPTFDKTKGDWSNVNPPKLAPSDADNRHVYSVSCSWNGPIAKVGRNGVLPACPHCGSMLFEQDAAKWREGVESYAASTNDRDYPKFVEWLSTRGKCSPMRTLNDMNALRSEFVNLNLI